MIILLNVFLVFWALAFLLASISEWEIGFFYLCLVVSLLIAFFNVPNLIDGHKEVYKKVEVKEVLSTTKVLTVENEVETYKESDIKTISRIQEQIEDKESTFYIVKYKTVSKERFDNTFFNRYTNTDWEIVSIEDLD